MAISQATSRFVLCLSNDGYAASLEARKLYEVLPDSDAEEVEMLRVIDESGEDYLYPRSLFGEVQIPEEVRAALRRAS